MTMLNTTYPMTLSDGTVNGQPVPDKWQDQCELADEITAADSTLTVSAWITILAAIKTGLPLVLTFDGQRTTVIVRHACVSGTSSRIRVAYWGFEHYIWLSQIISVSTPDIEFIPSGLPE